MGNFAESLPSFRWTLLNFLKNIFERKSRRRFSRQWMNIRKLSFFSILSAHALHFITHGSSWASAERWGRASEDIYLWNQSSLSIPSSFWTLTSTFSVTKCGFHFITHRWPYTAVDLTSSNAVEAVRYCSRGCLFLLTASWCELTAAKHSFWLLTGLFRDWESSLLRDLGCFKKIK